MPHNYTVPVHLEDLETNRKKLRLKEKTNLKLRFSDRPVELLNGLDYVSIRSKLD